MQNMLPCCFVLKTYEKWEHFSNPIVFFRKVTHLFSASLCFMAKIFPLQIFLVCYRPLGTTFYIPTCISQVYSHTDIITHVNQTLLTLAVFLKSTLVSVLSQEKCNDSISWSGFLQNKGFGSHRLIYRQKILVHFFLSSKIPHSLLHLYVHHPQSMHASQ